LPHEGQAIRGHTMQVTACTVVWSFRVFAATSLSASVVAFVVLSLQRRFNWIEQAFLWATYLVVLYVTSHYFRTTSFVLSLLREPRLARKVSVGKTERFMFFCGALGFLCAMVVAPAFSLDSGFSLWHFEAGFLCWIPFLSLIAAGVESPRPVVISAVVLFHGLLLMLPGAIATILETIGSRV